MEPGLERAGLDSSDVGEVPKINISMTQHADISLYHHFRTLNLSRSRRHFSSHWLGAAENYLALRGERGPSANVLIGLFQRLWREGRLLLAVRVGWMLLWMPESSR